MNKRLLVLSVTILGSLSNVFAQGPTPPPCPICPPDTPETPIDGLPLYLTLAAGVVLGLVFFAKSRLKSQKSL